MNNNALAFAGAAFGMVLAIIGGVQLGSSGTPPFEFGTASAEEQTAYLEKEAAIIAKQMKRGLVSPSGVGPSLSLADTKVDAGSKAIEHVIRVSGLRGRQIDFDRLQTAMLERVCPVYVRSALRRNDIRMIQTYETSRGSIGELTISPTTCERHAGGGA
jgi:hypothetical protein